ncbi:MAG: hypothetical protein HRT68_08770, partial [Flavobacteriaceae bacterium]|nr:hypothetical protein [Flavobacteriaceae bacterium]
MNPNGTLDASFNGTGVFQYNMGSTNYAHQIKLTPSGKIVVCGQTKIADSNHFTLIKLNDDGTFDTSFGSNGVSNVDNPEGISDRIVEFEILPDDSILAMGNVGFQFVLIKYASNG